MAINRTAALAIIAKHLQVPVEQISDELDWAAALGNDVKKCDALLMDLRAEEPALQSNADLLGYSRTVGNLLCIFARALREPAPEQQ